MRPQNKAFAKFVAIPVFALIGFGAIMGGGSGSSSPDEPEAKNAAEAAQVNDVVKIIYPSSTIMCAERNDASKVYIVGETTLRQTMRIENSVWKAIDAERDGQKRAMASAYSCERAPRKEEVRFVVQQKDIIGDKNSLFHTADYCLRPETSSDGKCFWIIATADMNPQIRRVGHAYTQQDADRLKDAGRKLQPDNGKL